MLLKCALKWIVNLVWLLFFCLSHSLCQKAAHLKIRSHFLGKIALNFPTTLSPAICVCVCVCVRDIKMDLRLITHEGCIFYQATVGTLPRNWLTLPQLASPGLPALLHCMHILFIRSSTRAAQLLNLCLAHSHHRPPFPSLCSTCNVFSSFRSLFRFIFAFPFRGFPRTKEPPAASSFSRELEAFGQCQKHVYSIRVCASEWVSECAC